MNPEPLVNLIDQLIARGIEPNKAADLASRIVFDDPWLTPDAVAAILKLHPKVINRNLRGNVFRGARKFSGRWRIPREAVMP